MGKFLPEELRKLVQADSLKRLAVLAPLYLLLCPVTLGKLVGFPAAQVHFPQSLTINLCL